MTDVVLITIYAFLTVLIVVATIIFAVHHTHQTLSYSYYWLSALVLGWLAVTIAFHLTKSAWLAEYLDNLTFIFIPFLPVIMLRFVLYFYHDGMRVSRETAILLCILPAITSIIAAVPALNWMLRSNYTMVQLEPLHIAEYTWNFWFYIHVAYCYIIIGICLLIILRRYKKSPHEYKVPSLIMIVSMGIIFISDLPSFSVPDAIVDNTLIGVCISMIALYFAIINSPTVAFLTAARKALYNNMDLPVFILNRQDTILDMNKAAHNIMAALGARPADIWRMELGDIAGVISDFGGTVKEGYAKDGLPHIFLPLNGENMVFKQLRRELVDSRGRPLGSYMVMMDITGLRRMVDELQYKAEVDVLTGIPNRRAFEQSIAAMDTPENLPLALVVGDVNRLKQVNDRFGHAQGDLLLKTVAAALVAACPERGFAARMGGDEFVLAIPRCNEEEARMVVEAIHAQLKGEENLFLGASIALGCVTKTRPEQDVNTLIHEADQRMYSQKQYDRRGGMARSV